MAGATLPRAWELQNMNQHYFSLLPWKCWNVALDGGSLALTVQPTAHSWWLETLVFYQWSLTSLYSSLGKKNLDITFIILFKRKWKTSCFLPCTFFLHHFSLWYYILEKIWLLIENGIALLNVHHSNIQNCNIQWWCLVIFVHCLKPNWSSFLHLFPYWIVIDLLFLTAFKRCCSLMQIRAATNQSIKKSIIIDHEKNRQQIWSSINCICHYAQKTSASPTTFQQWIMHFNGQTANDVKWAAVGKV